MIHFRCVRCQHEIKVDDEKVGKKMYCPVCYFEITVPHQSTIKQVDESELYATDSKPIDVRTMTNRQKFVSLRCPVCNTNIAVSKEQIGKILTCPDCNTNVRVPDLIAEKFKLAEEKWSKLNQKQFNHSTPTPQTNPDIYELNSNNTTTNFTKTIRVYCKLCGTLMYASESQIGSELTCPDCATKTTVPIQPKNLPTSTPPISILLPPVFEGGKTFDLANENSNSDNSLLVPVICNLCGTRMYAHESEIGNFKTCPDCGTKNEIKPVPNSEKIKPDLTTNKSYDINQSTTPEKRPVTRTLTDYRFVDGSLDKELHTKKSNPKKSRSNSPLNQIPDKYLLADPKLPRLPKYPFLTRIFVPLTCAMLWGRTIIGISLIAGGIIFSVVLPGLFFVISAGFGCIIVLHGLMFLADTFYTLFTVTMVGNDLPEKEDWNNFNFFEFGSIFIWLALLSILATLPGYLLLSYLNNLLEITSEYFSNNSTLLSALIIYGSNLLLFPILFLSSIENNSSFAVVGKTTCRSLISCAGVWLRFYFISILMSVCCCAILITLANLTDNPLITIVLSIPAWSTSAILYARFLGRLSWTIEEHTQQKIKKKNF
jgi:DNA-directed RNA polymerase subunit M/transcription elongation factor TFIIS